MNPFIKGIFCTIHRQKASEYPYILSTFFLDLHKICSFINSSNCHAVNFVWFLCLSCEARYDLASRTGAKSAKRNKRQRVRISTVTLTQYKKPRRQSITLKDSFLEYGISRKRYAVFFVCVHKCSASQALIKDIKLNSVETNCVRPRAFKSGRSKPLPYHCLGEFFVVAVKFT